MAIMSLRISTCSMLRIFKIMKECEILSNVFSELINKIASSVFLQLHSNRVWVDVVERRENEGQKGDRVQQKW